VPAPSCGATAPHAIAVYGSDDDLRSRVVPYLRGGLDRGETVVAVTTERAERALRAGLGDDADRVRWGGGEVAYQRLGRVLDGIRAFLTAQSAADVPTRLLTENDIEGDSHHQAAYLRTEAAANDLFRAYGSPCVCLYDRDRYPEQLLDTVVDLHPQRVDGDGRIRDNATYVEPEAYLLTHAGPLSPVPPTVALDVELTELRDLRAARRRVADAGRALGLPAGECDELLLAVNELATNAFRHGTPPARIRMWKNARSVIARVDDHGTSGHRAAVAGYHRPDPTAQGGMGLWLTRHLADVVHVDAGLGGTGVEVHVACPPQPTAAR
jgi:anti-sigma regulatory factor (Ser/Thr protein kinase)